MTLDWKLKWSAVPLIGLAVLVSACATTTPLPRVDLPVLIDPRLGYEGISSEPVDRKFTAAWQKLSSGQLEAADKAFTSIATKYPKYAPALLGRAVVALAKGQDEIAERYIERVADPGSSYFAAEAYRAEIAFERGLTEDAYRNYRRISHLANAPVIVSTRFEIVTDAWFEELLARAKVAETDRDRIDLLTEAIGVRPRADSTRIELTLMLVEAQEWTRAREELEVLLDRGLADHMDVQAILSDLERSEGRYQDAIVRLERLVRRYPGRGYEERLNAVKVDYMRANLPPRYHRAVASPAITRADLAVLAYWHVSAVRFANVSAPPIAVDIQSAQGRDGRDEMVKAMGVGLLSVDPATRTVGPDVIVTARSFANAVVRLTRLAAAPACAGNFTGMDALSACGVDLSPFLEDPSATVSGASAIRIFDAVAGLIESAKE